MDKDINRVLVIVAATMILILFLIVCVKVQPYYLVSQEHVLHAGDVATGTFDHPVLQPEVSLMKTDEGIRIERGEKMRIIPYDQENGTAKWRAAGGADNYCIGEYICNLSWKTGYTICVLGVDVFEGMAPSWDGCWALIDVKGSEDGRWNAIHIPEYITPGVDRTQTYVN
ncbi:MAG TPA: hypothetical protein VK436_14980 [Methanocella sp.]|nr:hypothetical protein [Methanocella sp.]